MAYNRKLARTRAKSKKLQKKFPLKPKCPKNFVTYIPNARKNNALKTETLQELCVTYTECSQELQRFGYGFINSSILLL